MSSGVLYHHFFSPPSRMALLAVRNVGLSIQVKNVDIYKGEQHSPEFLKINPLNQVPAYSEGDFVLSESKAIAIYLANSSNSPLYPKDYKQRALIDSKLFFDSTSAFPAVRNFVRPILRSGVKKVDQQTRDEVKVMLETLNRFLEKSEWFAGRKISLADIGFLASVGTIKCIGEDFSGFPKLKDWYARCKSLPGFDENEEGATALAVRLAELLDEPLWPKN